MQIVESNTWGIIATGLVGFHLACEYVHYLFDFFKGRKDSKILSDISDHRKKSTKTARLADIQKDLQLIKKHLGIK